MLSWNFLRRYRSHPEAHKVRQHLLAEFIRSMANEGELTSWTVALIGGGEGGLTRFDGDLADANAAARKYKTLASGPLLDRPSDVAPRRGDRP